MRRIRLLTLLLSTALVLPAGATWSIIIVDTSTREIAVASATCVPGIDLEADLPVVRVGVGAACAQALVDTSVRNRHLIWEELQRGTDPHLILQMLEAQDNRHQDRQYGIVDVQGRAVTFTGRRNGRYANGLTGQVGTLVYAIQGNVITGQPVLDEAERAIRETPGALPEKIMAAMEAARDMGGDGRCSCDFQRPDSCGSPPAGGFDRTAWVTFMIDTRRGDTDGGLCVRGDTCAGGDYYLNINIHNMGQRPIIERLRRHFDRWRADLVGKPDAVESTATLSTDHVLAAANTFVTLHLEVRDWQRLPATDITAVTVEHDDGSAGSSTIGPVQDLGGGVYEVTITPGSAPGRDRFRITMGYSDSDGDGIDEQVILMPSPTLRIQDPAADFNNDGVVDLADLSILLSSFAADAGGDLNGDGVTDLADLSRLLSYILDSAP